MRVTLFYVEEPKDAMYQFRRHGYSWESQQSWGWLLWLPFGLTFTVTGGGD